MDKLKSLGKAKLFRYGLQVAILLGAIVAAIKYFDRQELLSALRNANFEVVPIILLLVTGHLLLKARRFMALMEPFSDGLPRLVTVKAYIAGQAATLVPGGVAARAGLMKQVNVPAAESSAPVLFGNALDQLVFMGGSLVAALWFKSIRTPVLVLFGLLAGVGLLFLIPGFRQWAGDAADRVAEKLDKQETWHTFLEAVPEVLTARIVLLSFGLTLLAFATKVIALDFSMRSMGLNLSYPALFLGFVIPTLLGRFVPVPGGLGVTEASMISVLATITTAGTYALTLGVVIFRISTIFFLALLGAVVYYAMWDGPKQAAAESSLARKGRRER